MRTIVDRLHVVSRRRHYSAQRAAAESRARGAARLPLVFAVDVIIHATHVHEHLELELGLISQRAAHDQQIGRPHSKPELAGRSGKTLDSIAELGFDRGRECRVPCA